MTKTADEIKAFERNTVLQSESKLWIDERRKLLTASNFKRVCSRRKTTSCAKLVKNLVYPQEINSKAVKHGKTFEPVAKEKLERELNIVVQACGMFIDEKYPYLAATPDGIVDDHTLVEIKCPLTLYKKKIDDAISERKLAFFFANGTINKNHAWYFQIQGQLWI
ncbi:uncharacterized protein, partial [Tenebrio molitor]|uniref:uncharacterized protein n=1 Tax=Tenebrio molitor TaxID=7067 RepID=UPI0036246D2F